MSDYDGQFYTYTAPLPPDWNEADVEPTPTTLTGRVGDGQTTAEGSGDPNVDR